MGYKPMFSKIYFSTKQMFSISFCFSAENQAYIKTKIEKSFPKREILSWNGMGRAGRKVFVGQ